MRKSLFLILACLFLSNQLLFAGAWTFQNVNLQGMGYVTGIIAHPTGGTIYARTDTYGIYRWDSVNQRWIPTMDGKVDQASIESFAVSASDKNSIYAVGGNNQSGKLYKSTDQGETWTELSEFNRKGLNVMGNGAWRGAGERLAIDPNNGGKVIYFGSRNRGLWKSPDQGENWEQISNILIPQGQAGGVIFVVFDPSSGNSTTNSQRIYAGVQGMGVYSSTDGGQRWSLLPGGPSQLAFPCRAAIANDGTLYVSYASTDDGGGFGYIYKYSGSGNLINITPPERSSEGFWGISCDPKNANWLATFQWSPENGKGIHFSSDGGITWKSSGFTRATHRIEPNWYPTWAGWTYSAGLLVDPVTPDKVWLTTGFGVYRSENINVTSPKWMAQMTNLEELVVTTVKCPPADGGADLFTGFADMQGFRVENRDKVPATTFEINSFGICTGIAWCEADPNFVVTVGGDQNGGPSGESKNAKYRYSTNNGKSWTSFTKSTPTSVNGNIAVSSTDKLRWVIAPIDRNGVFNDPHFTTDGGKTWKKSNGTPADTENGCTQQWSSSEFLMADKVNGMTFYYYCDRSEGNWASGFYRSTDGGANFTKLYSGLPASYKSQIATVPGKEGWVFYCSKAGSSLYLTKDGGSSWNTIPGISNCSSIGFGKAVTPSTEPTIFVYATINGKKSLFQSTDFCKTWLEINDGTLPTNIASITGDMRTTGLVYMATGGRGVIYGLQSGNTSAKNTSGVQQLDVNVFPNPAKTYFNVSFYSNQSAKARLSIVNLKGEVVYSLQNAVHQGANNLHFATKGLSDGMYVLNCLIDGKQLQEKIIIRKNPGF